MATRPGNRRAGGQMGWGSGCPVSRRCGANPGCESGCGGDLPGAGILGAWGMPNGCFWWTWDGCTRGTEPEVFIRTVTVLTPYYRVLMTTAPGDPTHQPAEALDGVPVEPFADAPALDAWLAAHPDPQPSALWVKVAKKNSGLPSVTAAEVNDMALCHGWITGQRRSLDDRHYLQKITPRRPGSQWSMVNVRRVPELAAAGLMRSGGLAEIAAAQADGRWDMAYESQRNASVPDDLVAALERSPRAKAAFDALGRTDRYQVVLPLLKARTPDVRAARLAAAVAGLTDGPASPAC